MDMDFPDTVKSFLKKVIDNGDLTAYQQWASSYEADVNSMNYSGYESVVTKWRSYHSNLVSQTGEKHRVFDAGCGTGLVGELLARSVSMETVHLYGGDLISEMLKEAQSKAIYTELQIVNLKEELPYEANSFDSVICAGVFVKGHCGPECLPNIMRVLKPGCFFIATVTKELFDRTSEEWKKHTVECNWELMEKTDMPYREQSDAYVLVFRKNN